MPTENSLPRQWPADSVVVFMPGSLPQGGVAPMTPIHAFDSPPAPLRLQHQPLLQPRRRDIDLGDLLAFSIDEVVATHEADAIVEATERFGYRDEAPGISTPPGMRMNKSVHWVADDALTGPLFDRIGDLLPAGIDGAPLYPRLSQRLNMYRYDASDVFNRRAARS